MPAVVGRITVVDAERQEKAPFDPARAVMLLAFLGVLAGLFAAFAAAGVALVIILAILGIGLGFLGCLAGLVFMPLRMILSPIINAIRGDPTVSVLNFQVFDTAAAAPVDVVLYRRSGGGNVRLGDVVQVHGSVRRNTNVVRAWSVQVVESGGNPTNYRIDALKPLPLWVGLLFLLLAVAAALWLTGVV